MAERARTLRAADHVVVLFGETLALSPADAEAHNLLALTKLNRWRVFFQSLDLSQRQEQRGAVD